MGQVFDRQKQRASPQEFELNDWSMISSTHESIDLLNSETKEMFD